MFSIKILADEVLNLTDARYFSAMGVDYICLNHPQDPAKMSAEQAAAIASWLDGPDLVLHYHDGETFQSLRSGIDLGGVICKHQGVKSNNAEEEEWVKFLVHEVSDFEELAKEGISGTDVVLGYDYIILDLSKTGKSLDELIDMGVKPILQAICAAAPVFIKADVSANILASVLEEISPEGWVVSGGQEDKVGVKSYDALDDFFEALEQVSI